MAQITADRLIILILEYWLIQDVNRGLCVGVQLVYPYNETTDNVDSLV
jgi:hypothetical protein